MGKLLDQVLEIHNSRRNTDIADNNINNNIESINKKILDVANNGITNILISFDVLSDDCCLSLAYSNTTYNYFINESKSISYIKQKLIEYYKNEGFDIAEGNCTFTIYWTNKLLDGNE